MLIYIFKKIASFLLVLLLLSLISVAIIYYAPNSSFKDLTFFEVCQLFYEQIFFNKLVISNHSLWDIFTLILLPTFELLILVILISLVIGFPIGIITGLSKNSTISHFIKIISLLLYACPIIWLTVLVSFLLLSNWAFIENIQYQPAINSISLIKIVLTNNSDKYSVLWSELQHLFIPIVILIIQPCIITIQLISQQVSITAQHNFIKVANIRENSLPKVLFRHLLPNAIPAAIPQLTYNITTLFFSTMTIEIVLNRPGLGNWVFSALHQQNYIAIAFAIFSSGVLISLLTLLSELFVVVRYPMQAKVLYE